MNSDIKLSVYVPSLPPIIYFLARPDFLDDPPPLPPQTHFLNLCCVPALITHIFPFFCIQSRQLRIRTTYGIVIFFWFITISRMKTIEDGGHIGKYLN